LWKIGIVTLGEERGGDGVMRRARGRFYRGGEGRRGSSRELGGRLAMAAAILTGAWESDTTRKTPSRYIFVVTHTKSIST
jgi:hypothetical protein